MQTTVQNEKSIRLGSATLRIDGVNIGALQNAKLQVEMEVMQLKADNAELEPRKRVKTAKITCDTWEISIDNLKKFGGIGTVAHTPGSTQQVKGEKLLDNGKALEKGTAFVLKHANADGSAVTAVTLKNGSQTVEATKYTLTVIDGKTHLVFTGEKVASVDGLAIDYSYTPATAKTYTIRDVVELIETHRVELENVDATGKKFRIEFPKAYNVAGFEMQFQADDKLDEVMKCPLEFQAMSLPNKDLLIISDEQAVS